MRTAMPESNESSMARLDRVEASLARVTDVLVLQSERMDIGFASLREELQANRQEIRRMSEQTRLMAEQTRSMAEEVHGLREDTRATREETRAMRETLTDRLDRLIAITLKERTVGIERLANIEQRLARLEEHVGVTPV